jgi:glycosyltransferase involved in cell wall biosynthesis
MWYPRATSAQARLHNALYLGRVYRALLRGVSAVHVSNSYDASLFPAMHRWPRDRVVRIPYPYTAEIDEPPRRFTSSQSLRVLWAARLTEQKGVDTLLNIVHAINRSTTADDYRFVLAGSGEPGLEKEVRAVATHYDNVRYIGHVPHAEMRHLYGDADSALVTSNWETFPYACLEPQARGVVVVASDIPGCADIVENESTGFLFRPGDVSAAVAALTYVRELKRRSPVELRDMSRRAMARTRERFDPAVINDAMELMLLTVAGGERLGAIVER